jgi:hypothetical protein
MLLNLKGSLCTGHMTLPEVDKDETRGLFDGKLGSCSSV